MSVLSTFYLWAFVLAWAITIPIALQEKGVIAQAIVPSVMQWSIGVVPLIAAWIATRNRPERVQWKARATSFKAPPLAYVAALALPWLLLLVVNWSVNATSGQAIEFVLNAQVAIFFIIWLLLAYGEEAGWRALALPEHLRQTPFFISALVLGCVWCIWHYPKNFASPFLEFNREGITALAAFSAQIICANFLICWMYLRTRSIGIPTVFHASWNTMATAYPMAGIDNRITAALLIVIAIVFAYDRKFLVARGNSAP